MPYKFINYPINITHQSRSFYNLNIFLSISTMLHFDNINQKKKAFCPLHLSVQVVEIG